MATTHREHGLVGSAESPGEVEPAVISCGANNSVWSYQGYVLKRTTASSPPVMQVSFAFMCCLLSSHVNDEDSLVMASYKQRGYCVLYGTLLLEYATEVMCLRDRKSGV